MEDDEEEQEKVGDGDEMGRIWDGVPHNHPRIGIRGKGSWVMLVVVVRVGPTRSSDVVCLRSS